MSTAEEWNRKGLELFGKGRYREAIQHFDKALATNPQLAVAWHNKGASTHRLKRYDEAILYFDRALAINAELVIAWLGKGLCLRALRRYEQAIECYDKALEINPRYADALNDKGHVLFTKGLYQEALDYFDKALEIDPQHALANMNKKAALSKWSHSESGFTGRKTSSVPGTSAPSSLNEAIVGWFHDVVREGQKVSLVFYPTQMIVVAHTLSGLTGFGLGALRKLDNVCGVFDFTGTTTVFGWVLSAATWGMRQQKEQKTKEEVLSLTPQRLLAADGKNFALPYTECQSLLVEPPLMQATSMQDASLTAVTTKGVHKFNLRLHPQDIQIFEKLVGRLQQTDMLAQKLQFVRP